MRHHLNWKPNKWKHTLLYTQPFSPHIYNDTMQHNTIHTKTQPISFGKIARSTHTHTSTCKRCLIKIINKKNQTFVYMFSFGKMFNLIKVYISRRNKIVFWCVDDPKLFICFSNFFNKICIKSKLKKDKPNTMTKCNWNTYLQREETPF